MAKVADSVERESYRAYVTDALRAAIGADVRWHDTLSRRSDIDAEAVVEGVVARLAEGGEE